MFPGRVIDKPAETYDMFEILRSVGAEALLDMNGVSLKQAKTPVDMSLKDLADLARAQLQPVLDNYPEPKTHLDLITGDKMLSYDLSDETNWTCAQFSATTLLSRTHDKIEVVKIRCEDIVALGGRFVVHVFLKEDLQK